MMQISRNHVGRFSSAILIAWILLTSVAFADDANVGVGTDPLASVERDWNAGAGNWNSDALADVYTADALFFGGRAGHSVGREGIRSYFMSYNSILKSATLNLVKQHVIKLAPNVFVAQGYGKFHFLLSTGKETDSVLRTTLVIVKRGGKWKVIDHHFSPTPEAPPIPK